MDKNSDRASGSSSASASDMKNKKQKVDDYIDEEDRRRYRSMAKVAIENGINPSVQDSFISELVQIVCPTFTLDTSKLERTVLAMYEEGKEKVKKLLSASEYGRLTLSYDSTVAGMRDEDFEGPVLHDEFIVVCAYFADEKFKIKKWVLGYHPCQYGKDVYVDCFKNVIQEYGVESKVSTLLVPTYGDLGGKEFDDFRKWREESGRTTIDSRVFLIYCCADLFRLMVDDMYEDIKFWVMDFVRMLIHWRSMVPAHWDVTLSTMQKAVDMNAKNVFDEEEYDRYDRLPFDEDWIKIETFCKLAGYIHKVAKELFEGEYQTANGYFHLLAELKFMLNQELKSKDNEYMIVKAKETLVRFDKYWDDMFLVLATASVLDPRFKMKYLEFYCSKNGVSDESSKAETVLDYIRNLHARYASSDIRPQLDTVDAAVYPRPDWMNRILEEDEAEREEEVEEEKPDVYKEFAFFQEYLKFEGSSREFGESELDSYLKEPVLEWNKDLNALDWWKAQSQKYPILSRVARDILSIPISRATSQRAFVANRRECPEFVVSVEAKLMNAMMCSGSWPRK